MREKILADIREALKSPMPDPHHDPGPSWPVAPTNGKGLIEQFRENFEAVGGVWLESERDLPSDAEISDCDVAIAETGSFGLIASSKRGRMAGLACSTHAVRVRRDQFVATLEDWLAYLEPRLRRQAVLITGPSRSADIEQIITIGVHGPGKVYAVLCA